MLNPFSKKNWGPFAGSKPDKKEPAQENLVRVLQGFMSTYRLPEILSTLDAVDKAVSPENQSLLDQIYPDPEDITTAAGLGEVCNIIKHLNSRDTRLREKAYSGHSMQRLAELPQLLLGASQILARANEAIVSGQLPGASLDDNQLNEHRHLSLSAHDYCMGEKLDTKILLLYALDAKRSCREI